MTPLETEILFFYQRRQAQQQYVAIREMALLGGKWVGEKHKWSPPDEEPIRLEIFHATPSEILDQADNMLLIDYPQLTKPVLQNKFPSLMHNVVSFTLRNANNDLLAIASLQLLNDNTDAAIIRQIVICEKLRGARNGSFLLSELEKYASKAAIEGLATKILNFMPKDFYLKKGYKIINSVDVELGTKVILYKRLPEFHTSPRSMPKRRV
jgi:N-acetylglutamate synthase-like GNAT family acetyltransferase